jgi:pyruvate dehydrogenase E2 component (dihydrolipoamide acetyltransferase)
MMEKIVMPRIGLTQEEGTIVQWKVAEGDAFSEGDILAEMESDKSTSEITAEFSGKLEKILVQVDESCAVGEPIAEAERI